MALQTSGAISINDIAEEFNCEKNLLACAVAAGLGTTNISMNLFYGLSSGPAGVLAYTLNNPNAYSTSASDYFGYSVAISGDRCIVGAYGEDDSRGYDVGRCYIYNVSTGGLVHTLTNPDTSFGFGQQIDISGDKCIIGVLNAASQSGKAYIFDVNTGGLVRTLNNPASTGQDRFGRAVSISGDKGIVGAYLSDSGGSNSGAAYIFNVNTGALVRTLNNPNAYSTSAGDYFGFSVSISGDKCIVGAYAEDDAGGSSSGKAYIFDVNTGAVITLNNPNAYSTSASDYFGYSVAISGDRCIVGAWQEDDPVYTGSGKAYIFDVNTGALLHTLNNPNPTASYERFGWSVDISGSTCVVGAYRTNSESGTVYVFDTNTGSLLYTFNNPNAYGSSTGDSFGYSVAIDGTNIIAGAYREDDAGGTSAGKAYVYN